MTNTAQTIRSIALALMLSMTSATPASAQDEPAAPPVPSQQEMATLMEMARQMMGMLPQMVKTLEALEKELDRIDMEPIDSLGLTDQQKLHVREIQKDYRQTQTALAGEEKVESARLKALLAAERPDPALVAEQQMRVDDVRRQMLVARIAARNRLYDMLTEGQRQQLRRNEPQWLKDFYPAPKSSSGAFRQP